MSDRRAASALAYRSHGVQRALEFVTLASASCFAGGALYVSLVEHPARLADEPRSALAQFRHSYARAAPWQGITALLALAAGVSATALGSSWLWAAGGGLVGSAVPLTLIAILPTNNRLLAEPPPAASDARELLQRWSRLHAIRATVGAAGLLMLICEVVL